MKPSELMAGDWVVISEDHPDCPFARQVDIGDLSFFTKFKPIPITEEILNMNRLYDCWEFYDGWHFKLADKKKSKAISVGSIWFVHELQHALRLCGLDDLANNLKIE